MAELLWQKPGVAVDAQIQRFLAGDDVILDREFFLHDIAASHAHAQGLQRIGILSAGELEGLERELALLADDFRSGAFVLDERYEDCHSAIEARLTERLGDAGRKIHTGRSRNDQVLVATRLWLKERLAEVFGTIAPDEPRKRRVLTMTRTLLSESSFGQTRQFKAIWCDLDRAIALATQLQPDMVIMDISMPVLNGLKATKRSSASQMAIPAGLLSSSTSSRSCADAPRLLLAVARAASSSATGWTRPLPTTPRSRPRPTRTSSTTSRATP